MPSGRAASFVTQTILVSALVYCAGSSTKSKTSSGVTPFTTAVPSPRITVLPPEVVPALGAEDSHGAPYGARTRADGAGDPEIAPPRPPPEFETGVSVGQVLGSDWAGGE